MKKFYIICSLLIALGAISTISLISIFNVHSGEYGSVVIWEQFNEDEVFSKFENMDFQSTDFVHYQSVTSYPPQKFNGKNNNYSLRFNNQPVNHLALTAGRISGDLELKFYDTNGTTITTAKLNILVEYLAQETRVTISMTSTENAISYFNSYININDSVLRVIKEVA